MVVSQAMLPRKRVRLGCFVGREGCAVFCMVKNACSFEVGGGYDDALFCGRQFLPFRCRRWLGECSCSRKLLCCFAYGVIGKWLRYAECRAIFVSANGIDGHFAA